MWKTLKKLISNREEVSYQEIIYENQKIRNVNQIASIFNTFFIKSLNELAESVLNNNLNDLNETCMADLVPQKCFNNFKLVNEMELIN